jgi:hypothetical protein
LYIGVMSSANMVQLILVKLQKRKSRQRVSGRSGTSPLDLFSDANQQILDPRKRLPSIDGSLPEPCEDPGWVLGSTTLVDHSPSSIQTGIDSTCLRPEPIVGIAPATCARMYTSLLC